LPRRFTPRNDKKGRAKIKNIWVLSEINPTDGEVTKQSLGLLAAARTIAAKVGGAVTALLFSDRPLDVAKTLGNQGIPHAYIFHDALFDRFSAEAYAAALLPRVRQEKPWLLLMGNTPAGNELAPHLAALLETGLVSDCVKMDFSDIEHPKFYRPVYGGQLYQELVFATDKTMLVTMDAKALNPAPPTAEVKTKTIVIESNLPADLIKTTHLEYLPADFQTVDVTEADTIVAAGMGAATDELYPLVAELAALVEGAIGTTRPVVDGGIIPRDRLIGQTGKTVSPDFYLALGISGATHHTGGIQESGKIVAVNRDPQAPIFRNADAGAVADLKEVLPKLIARIKKARADGEIL
jgi:electron transfer flavoprotein alpha subunit